MRQNFFTSVAVALVAVATLASTKNAKADIIGVGLGYEFDPSRIAIEFLIPLKHHGAKRPQGGVLNLGLNIRGSSRQRNAEGRSFDWIGFSIPVAYEHVFDSGISILGGLEFAYYSNDENFFSNDEARTFDSSNQQKDYGGGVVLGTHYFFKSGVFLGLRLSAGVGHSTYTYQRKTDAHNGGTDTETKEGHTSIYAYTSPTLSVGYMF